MHEVAVVTDSAANLPAELVRQYHIHVVPLWLRLGERLYRDQVDITADEFYRRLRDGKGPFSTSQPSVGEFVEVYQRLAEQARAIVSIHLPKKLSGTLSSAMAAARQVSSLPIRIVDSGSACMGQGFVVLAAARLAAAGASLTDVVEKMREVISRVQLLATLDTLEYVVRGGRLSVAANLLRPALRVKPMLSLQAGQLRILGLARGRARAAHRLLELMTERAHSGPLHVAVFHADALERAEHLRQAVAERFYCAELHLTTLTPVLGAHGGPGALGVTFYWEE
ncbi:MAG TPA: DegV family protein [Thermoflexia bacterium]|nr:MAG: DegV family protein [Chloroflexota bacterium]HEY68087.1 DegV family protein [Thermoflexia bacterium]